MHPNSHSSALWGKYRQENLHLKQNLQPPLIFFQRKKLQAASFVFRILSMPSGGSYSSLDSKTFQCPYSSIRVGGRVWSHLLSPFWHQHFPFLLVLLWLIIMVIFEIMNLVNNMFINRLKWDRIPVNWSKVIYLSATKPFICKMKDWTMRVIKALITSISGFKRIVTWNILPSQSVW